MNKTIIKGLIAALIAWFAAYFQSTIDLNWVYVSVYAVSFTLLYLAKNYKWPSTSPLGFINVWDVLSGLLIAVFGGLADWAAQLLTGAIFNWHTIWVTASTTAVAYLLSKFGFGQKQTV
jgi:hypothetical protein